MTYARTFLFSWSRRDRLAVVLIATIVAFVVGTTLVLAAVSAETTSVAAQFDTVGEVDRYDSLDAARAAAGPESVLMPIAAVNGDQSRTIVGVPSASQRPNWLEAVQLAAPPDAGIATVDPFGDQATLNGRVSTVTVPLRERQSREVLPDHWDVAAPSLVERLGPTSVLVLAPSSAGAPDDRGTSMQSSLVFFQRGSQQIVDALSLIGIGTALLVGVVVYGVVRMTALDRRQTVFVIRATGGTRRRVLVLFALRGAMLAAAGVALGYALGVIATNLAVNVAVALGLPTSLSTRVSPMVVRLLSGAALAIVALAAVAAPLAARPVATHLADTGTPVSNVAGDGRVPAGEYRRLGKRLRGWLSPRLVSARTTVPITLSLWTFVVIAFLLVAGATAAAPLSGGGATVVEPGAVHPVASTVPEAYADALASDGTHASPEILAFTVIDGNPVLVRGARYGDFTAVSDATLTNGRPPTGPGETVVGRDLAMTLDLEPGQTVMLGGSTTPAVTTVKVVGIYEAPGPYDDSFLVPLATARHLTNRAPGTVQFIRTTGHPGSEASASTATSGNVTVVSLSTPATVPRGEQTSVDATLVNPGSSATSRTLSLSVGGTQVSVREITISPLATREISFNHAFGDEGNHSIRMGSLERSVRVVSPDRPVLSELPAQVPAGSQPIVHVRTVTGDPIGNATVSVGNQTYRTAADGSVRIRFSTAGTRTVTVVANDHEIQRRVTVTDSGERTLVGSLSVSPPDPGPLVSPTVRIALANPWNGTVSSQVELRTGNPLANQSVTLDPGEQRTIVVRLDRRGPGTYPVVLAVDGRLADQVNVTVDDGGRLTSALATTDATVPASGLGTGVSIVLGNLTILAGTLAALAGVLAIGSIAAGLAGAVHGRRQTVGIYRATGASPRRIARLVVGDALRLGVLATPIAVVLALGALEILAMVDRLVFFGVRVHPWPSLKPLVFVVGGALVLVVVSGVAVTVGLLRTEPARLLEEASSIVGRVRNRNWGGTDGD